MKAGVGTINSLVVGGVELYSADGGVQEVIQEGRVVGTKTTEL